MDFKLKDPKNDAEVLLNWVIWKKKQKAPLFVGERGYLTTVEDLLTQTLAWNKEAHELKKLNMLLQRELTILKGKYINEKIDALNSTS